MPKGSFEVAPSPQISFTLLWGWGRSYLPYLVTSRKSGTRIPRKIKPQRLDSSRPLTEAPETSHPSLISLDLSGRSTYQNQISSREEHGRKEKHRAAHTKRKQSQNCYRSRSQHRIEQPREPSQNDLKITR